MVTRIDFFMTASFGLWASVLLTDKVILGEGYDDMRRTEVLQLSLSCCSIKQICSFTSGGAALKGTLNKQRLSFNLLDVACNFRCILFMSNLILIVLETHQLKCPDTKATSGFNFSGRVTWQWCDCAQQPFNGYHQRSDHQPWRRNKHAARPGRVPWKTWGKTAVSCSKCQEPLWATRGYWVSGPWGH